MLGISNWSTKRQVMTSHVIESKFSYIHLWYSFAEKLLDAMHGKAERDVRREKMFPSCINIWEFFTLPQRVTVEDKSA